MKFPSSNWQEAKGFERAQYQCSVCPSTHDLGCTPLHGVVCRKHANCTPEAIRLVVECREHGTRVSKDVSEAGRWNSYDRDALLPHLSDELLVEQTAYTLKNCGRLHDPATTYEEAIQLYAKELGLRLGHRLIDDSIKELRRHPPVITPTPGVTEIVIQSIDVGGSCIGDVVNDDLSIE